MRPRGDEPVVKLGTIEIPKIGLSTTLYDGIRLTTLDRGPGHWPGTAMPGETGNVVVAGHRVSHDKPFRNIDKLAVGDQVIFTTSAGRFVYDVTSTEIVDPTAIRIIDQTSDKTATLFACHPPGSVSQRIVVHLAVVGGAPLAPDGVLTEERVGEILREAGRQGVLSAAEYPRDKWAFLLRLMNLFQLSFPLDEEGEKHLVPTLLPAASYKIAIAGVQVRRVVSPRRV